MLDDTFVDAIAELATSSVHAANKAAFLAVPGDDRKHMLVKPDGSLETVDLIKPLVPKLDRVESLYQIAQESMCGEFGALFLSAEKLVYVEHIRDRRSRAVCELKLTGHAAALKSPRRMAQAEFLDLLRLHFAERIDVNVIDKIKGIRFRKDEEGQAQVGHQAANNSISRSVQIESLAGGSIPDKVPVMVRPYTCFDYEAEVTCAVSLNLESKTFALIPIAEELDGLFVQALDEIGKLRTKDHPPLYFGRVNVARVSDED